MNLIIFGCGQQGRVCKRLAIENGFNVIAFVDDGDSKEVERVPVYKSVYEVPNYQNCKAFVGVGNVKTRKKFLREIKNAGIESINLIDSHALIEDGATIGAGNYISKNAIIFASATIGNHNIINCNSVIATDAVVGNNNNISLGVNVCGGVHIGNDCYIGCQASIASGVDIQDDSVIGSTAFVRKDVKHGQFVCGVPAEVKL